MSKNILKLYQYHRLTDEKHIEYIKNYLMQMVWLTRLDNFNDPFEGKFIPQNNSPEVVARNPEYFNAFLDQFNKNSNIRISSEEFKKLISNEDFQKACKITSETDNVFRSWGALCLTKSYNNIPMWAYYADNHRGCCIEFEIDFDVIKNNMALSSGDFQEYKKSLLDGSEMLSFNLKSDTEISFIFLKVNYLESPPSIDFELLFNMKEMSPYDRKLYVIQNSIGVKFNQWKHEDEFRIISNANSYASGLVLLPTFIPFIKVTGVILGEKVTPSNKSAIMTLCEAYQVPFYHAKCSTNLYQISVDGYSS